MKIIRTHNHISWELKHHINVSANPIFYACLKHIGLSNIHNNIEIFWHGLYFDIFVMKWYFNHVFENTSIWDNGRWILTWWIYCPWFYSRCPSLYTFDNFIICCPSIFFIILSQVDFFHFNYKVDKSNYSHPNSSSSLSVLMIIKIKYAPSIHKSWFASPLHE
jgi:hypothetical protein